MAGLLHDDELSPHQRDLARTIRASGDALLTVINDILDFSKIEAGRLELEIAPFSLRECVEDALALFASAAEQKGLALTATLAPGVPSGVSARRSPPRSSNWYISFSTMSVVSPLPFSKRAAFSKMGVSMRRKPKRCVTSSAVRTTEVQYGCMSGRMSCVPRGAWKRLLMVGAHNRWEEGFVVG
jgi:hypothetical protein